MCTRSYSNLVGESSPNPTTSNPKCRNRRRSKQPFSLEESPVDTMTDQRIMAELLCAPTEGYAKAIEDRYKDLFRACPHHGFTELHQLDTFYNALNPANQDSLNSAVGGNLLERSYSRCVDDYRKQIQAKLTHAVNHQTSVVTTAMTAILKKIQATPPPAFVKAVEEICVTCGGAHSYYQCLAADGNTFPEYRDNIQGYVVAPAGNYNQGNFGYRPPGVANQTRPLAPIQQNQSVPLSELEKIKKINDVNINAMQAQINNVKNELRNEMQTSIQASMSNQTNELKNMMASFFQMNTASTSGSGSLPSNTVANPRGELKAITTQIGLVLDGPSVHMPPPFINPEEDERVEETLTDPELAEYTIKVPPPLVQKAKPTSLKNYVVHKRDPLYPNIPYPSRMHQEKQQEKDEVQIHKFWQMFKQVHINVLRDGDERLILNMRHDTSSYSNKPQKESINKIDIYNVSHKDYLEDLFANEKITNHLSGNPTPISDTIVSSSPTLTSLEESDLIWEEFEAYLASDSFPPGSDDTDFDPEGDLRLIEELLKNDPSSPLPLSHNPLSGSTTSSSPDHLLEEFADELALITFPPGNDDLPFDIESDLREIEYLLNHDPTKEMDSILEDSVDEGNLADPNNDLVDTIPEMFTDEHTLDYSSPPLYDDVDDDLVELESDNDDVYDDPFDSKEDKIKESKLLIGELDPPRSSDFLPSQVTIRATPNKNVKKISISNASLILEDFIPPLYELPFHKEVPGFETLLSFSSPKNEGKSVSTPDFHF
ncbi:hypothetical protein Tco_1467046 [Tanacetum coccineum]